MYVYWFILVHYLWVLVWNFNFRISVFVFVVFHIIVAIVALLAVYLLFLYFFYFAFVVVASLSFIVAIFYADMVK